jgi:hypothetical protein
VAFVNIAKRNDIAEFAGVPDVATAPAAAADQRNIRFLVGRRRWLLLGSSQFGFNEPGRNAAAAAPFRKLRREKLEKEFMRDLGSGVIRSEVILAKWRYTANVLMHRTRCDK